MIANVIDMILLQTLKFPCSGFYCGCTWLSGGNRNWLSLVLPEFTAHSLCGTAEHCRWSTGAYTSDTWCPVPMPSM